MMSTELKKCFICFKVSKLGSSTAKIFDKLQFCIPEKDWDRNSFVCCKCIFLLNVVYKFRKRCLSPNWKNLKFQKNTGKKKSSKQSYFYPKLNFYNCFKCNSVFKCSTQLYSHNLKIHNSKRPFDCSFCKSNFETCLKKNYHEKFHLKNYYNYLTFKRKNKPTVIIPKIDTNQRKHQKSEVNSHGKNEVDDKKTSKELYFQCTKCNNKTNFSSRCLLKRHESNVHAKEKKFECEVCNQKFTSLIYLKGHKLYHSGDRPHICYSCGKRFVTASDLYHHEKIHANKRAYKCNICPKAFNTSSDLYKHKMCVHMDRNLWKYMCQFCQKRFPLKINLETHVKIHTGERNFACHICSKKFINRSVLTKHVETHSNIKKYECSVCGFQYKMEKSMKIHLKRAHDLGNMKIPPREKKFFCHLCPKSYFANNKLQTHIRTHTGEKPFSCPLCQKNFSDNSYIKQHLKISHNFYEPS